MKLRGFPNFPIRLFVISIVFSLATLFIYHRVEYSKLKKREVELVKTYKKTLEHLKKSQKQASNLPLVRARLDSLLKVWEKVQASLPSEANLDFWLRATAEAGSRAGIEFERFEPGKVKSHNLYEEYPVDIEISGGYHEVATFLSFLLNLQRISHIKEVKVNGIKNPTFPTETVKASFTLSTYRYNPLARAPESTKKKSKTKRRVKRGKETSRKGKT